VENFMLDTFTVVVISVLLLQSAAFAVLVLFDGSRGS
jgi:hypothetical protein